MQINLNPTSERGASRDAVNRPRETFGDSHLISLPLCSRFGLVCSSLPGNMSPTLRKGGFYGWPWYYLGAHQDLNCSRGVPPESLSPLANGVTRIPWSLLGVLPLKYSH